MTWRAIQTAERRRQRDEQKRGRELERRAKQMAKLTALEQARFEVEAHENRIALLLSIHKEQGEAAREEELIRKAMETAERQAQQGNEQQRAKYERQLQELAQKLKEAEDKNRRALSMAQQTKRGHVYIVSNIGSFGEHVYKIGLTRRLEPMDRINELGDSSVPFDFDVHALVFSEDAPALEAKLHNHFVLKQINKVDHRKEFFRIELQHIREEIEKLGFAPKWTMAAQAAEYQESLLIERKITGNPALKEAWINRQFDLEMDDMKEAEAPVPVEVGNIER